MTVLNIDDLRRQAKRTLPRFAFSYLEGGADDEQTLQDNRRVFGRWRFIPPVLTDATQRDLSVTLCGQKLAAPLFIAPTGYNGMLRFGADVMLARAPERRASAIYRVRFRRPPLKRSPQKTFPDTGSSSMC